MPIRSSVTIALCRSLFPPIALARFIYTLRHKWA